MPYLRTDVAKMSETILSLGGTPPSGAGDGADHNRRRPSSRPRPLPGHLMDADKDFGRRACGRRSTPSTTRSGRAPS